MLLFYDFMASLKVMFQDFSRSPLSILSNGSIRALCDEGRSIVKEPVAT